MVLPLFLLLLSLFLVAFGSWLTVRRIGRYRWKTGTRREGALSDLARMVVSDRREEAGEGQPRP